MCACLCSCSSSLCVCLLTHERTCDTNTHIHNHTQHRHRHTNIHTCTSIIAQVVRTMKREAGSRKRKRQEEVARKRKKKLINSSILSGVCVCACACLCWHSSPASYFCTPCLHYLFSLASIARRYEEQQAKRADLRAFLKRVHKGIINASKGGCMVFVICVSCVVTVCVA